jgi:hypothetical protein
MNKKCGNSNTAKPAIAIVLYIRMVILLKKNSTREIISSDINRIKMEIKKLYAYVRITHNIIPVRLEFLMVVTIKNYYLLRCYVV